MPASKNHDTLKRWIQILRIIQQAPNALTEQEITERLDAKGYKVNKRTVNRNLTDIQNAFPEIGLSCNESGKAHEWSIPRNTKPFWYAMRLNEALVLNLLNEHLKQVLPHAMLEELIPQFEEAKQTILKHHQNKETDWFKRITIQPATQSLLAPEVDPAIQEDIYRAVFEQKTISAKYQGMNDDQPKKFFLHPIGLLVKGNVIYLGATVEEHEKILLFALHRFYCVRVNDESSVPNTSMTWKRYITQGAGGFMSETNDMIELTAWVNENLGKILSETKLSPNQQLTPETLGAESGFRLSATVANTWQLTYWILSQGSAIKIHAPTKLRENIIAEIAQMQANYSQ